MRGRAKAAPLRFRPWPDLMSGGDPRSARIHRDRLNEEADRAFAHDALAKRELLVGRDEEQLQAALTEIYRTARAAQQEGGANTLFLTIGALLWRPKGKDKPYRAPLILVPVVLDRPSVRSGFLLRAHDDETRVNATLLEMLRQEFAIRLPELEEVVPEDGSGLDVKAILDAFRRKLRDIPGWEVTEEVALTNLSFTKYLMWKDLADRADALRESEVARRLMDGPAAAGAGADPPAVPRPPGGTDHAGATLDDELAAADLACPMEADSSQLGAVIAAARGESFVLIGPPGTGKSQTITNIIANALAQGRTVLFAAEKRAALEVVQRRLRQAGLGDFCLDLFSAKASKVAVLEQLNRAQQAREHLDEEEWRRAGEEAAALRAELNGYVRELHRRGRNGWTAYRAIGCLLRAETGGVPEIALGWPGADAHDTGDYQRLVEAVEDAAATLSRLGDGSARAALAGIECPDWSPSWQASLVEAARAAAAALVALQDAVAPAVRALALPADLPLTRPALEAMDALAGLLLDPTAPEAAWALGDGGAQEVREALAPLCRRDPGAVVPESRPDWPGALAGHLRGWVEGARHLHDWCAWQGVVQRAEALGLAPLLSAMEAGTIAPSEAVWVFEANYARWWVALAVEDLPRLRAFVAAQHEQRIARFRALDARLLQLSARLVRARLTAGIPGTAERQRSAEYVLLARELARRQRHLPVRQLVARMPQAIRRLTPCLMMSPLSVAQYLPADAAPFDLVIFDEASQIPTWDAIGAVGRGRQVIVVGDPKQLPPTRFFERALPEAAEGSEERAELGAEDLESILDECLGVGIPSVELTWHYRSRHESLIAFSNHTYYGGRLVTFPSPVVRDAAVSYRHVPDGVYARAGSRTNQAEARAVVAEVVGRLRHMADGGREHSIGVVTFNAEQQALIEDLLDAVRREDPSLERFFADDHPEPVLVKNLEGVQGEERDVVVFSLTYGPDASGRVAMNFGPLNQSGGSTSR